MDDKEFAVYFEEKVMSTIEEYDLFDKRETVFVAASGGKDSTVLLHILHKYGYNIEAISVDARIGCYTADNLERLKRFCEQRNVKLHVIDFRKEFGKSMCYIRSVLNSKGYNYKSCNICGVLRRYLLNKYSRELKASKLALGHNLDDEAQAFLMNFLRGNNSVNARLGPSPGVIKDAKFVQRVKPLYFLTEAEVIRYSKINGFDVKYGECPCSSDSYRRTIRKMLHEEEAFMPDLKRNILNSFLGSSTSMKEYYSRDSEVLDYCGSCSEPCRGSSCNACDILAKLAD